MLGPLGFRDFRLLFAARAVSLTGSAIAPIALAFGVLAATGQATDLGIVLATRQAITTVLLLGGGVLADRVDRRVLMVAASLASCVSEAVIGALLLTHTANLLSLCVFAAIDGAGDALFFPASAGLTPSTVSAEHLQRANSLIGFARNGASMLGAAIGGGLVAVVGPGVGIEIDSLSFLGAAILIAFLRVPPAEHGEKAGFFSELREGWDEFRSRTWLWTIVVMAGLVNMAFLGALFVLAPLRSKALYGGAGAYGLMLALFSTGALLGGALMLRFRPRRPLFIGLFGTLLLSPELALLALGAPLWTVLVSALAAGAGVEVFEVLWITTMQREIAPDRLSRVSSYDALGSFIFIPVGEVIAAPVALLVGLSSAFWLAAAMVAVPSLLLFGVRDIRRLTSDGPASARSVS
jgi:MFS family permease